MKQYKMIFAAMIGNAFEYYDVMLYGFFAATLAPLFFPADNPTVSTLASLGAFAAGFVMRPLGGIVFGHIGDKYGRRSALSLSVILVTIPTLAIGVLPTYEVIGVAAPILLIGCRLLQGLCVGGEFSGAATFIMENAPTYQYRRGLLGGTLCAFGFLGGLLGTLIGFLCTTSVMPSWGWRIPFIMGSFIGIFGFYLRRRLAESPEYNRAKTQHKLERFPLLEIFKHRKRNLLCALGIGAGVLPVFYIAAVYMNVVLATNLGLTPSQIMAVNIGLNLYIIILLPIFGSLGDKIGLVKLMKASCIALILAAYPVFYYLDTHLSLSAVIFVQAVLLPIGIAFGAPHVALVTSLFPAQERHSGFGFGDALGYAIFGGTAPLISASLVAWTGMQTAPAFYLMFTGFMALNAVIWSRPEGARDPIETKHPKRLKSA